MAFNEQLVEKIEKSFIKKQAVVEGNKFMGGYFFSWMKKCVLV